MTFYSNVKQKSYVLNPRGKPLYEDANRFGTKMLEKMGWSKGKGLGIKEDGEQNFIRVSHKTDQKGMGYQDRDDQWTGHENQFTNLLESLNNSQNPSEDEKSCDDDEARIGFGFNADKTKSKKAKSIKSKLSGKSLEEMSKKSGVRVHYRKFTRGKDISRYSEQELANIFGKKCVNGDVVEKTDQDAAEQNEVDTAVESNYGITTIETGTSVQDYFKMKKRKKELGGDGDDGNVIIDSNDVANTEHSEKKRRKKDKLENTEENVAEPIECELTNESKSLEKKKKKKKSKDKTTEEDPQPVPTIDMANEDSVCETVPMKTKKKKRKDKKDDCNGEGTDVIDAPVDHAIETKIKKKKRDKKRTIEATAEPEEVNTIESKSINSTQFIDGILGLLVNHCPYSSTASLKQSNADYDNTQTPQSSSSSSPPQPNAAASNLTLAKPTSNIAMDQVFEINRYHAEMFRFVDLDGFPSANLSELSGYGYSNDFELKISEKSKDQTKINDLWDCALVNKYGQEVIQAKKAKKTKQYSISKLKKKNLFRQL